MSQFSQAWQTLQAGGVSFSWRGGGVGSVVKAIASLIALLATWVSDDPHMQSPRLQPPFFETVAAPIQPQQFGSAALPNSPVTDEPTQPIEVPLPKFKNRALQKISISSGWLGATNSGDLSSSFVNAGFTLGMPLGSMDNLLAVTPNMRTDFFNNDSALEVPSTLHDIGIELFHTRKINDRWKAIGLVRPSYRSDFIASQNAVKVFGLGLLNWECKPERLTLSMGAVYLGRSDISTLPVAGLTWTPNTRNRFELQFPRTRLLHRLRKDGDRSEMWSYLTASIGGNTWAVKRSSGAAGEFSVRDLRLMTGIEKTVAGGGGWFVETGLALDRSVEFLSDKATRRSLANGVIIAAGWIY